MKNLYMFFIILAAMILIVPAGYCQGKEVKVYFGNGVWNTQKNAKDSQLILQERLENVLTTNDLKTSWEISYNNTDGLYDLFEAAQQSASLAWTDFWKALVGLDLLPDFLQDELKKIAVKFDEDLIKSYPSIQEHVKKYNKDLCEGKKVVVVAHSQGNLFANIAYKGINDPYTDAYTAGQYYPCSGEIPGTFGLKDEVNEYKDLTAESPFIDRTEIAITLETENKHNFRQFGECHDKWLNRPATPVSCEALSKQESLSEFYNCGGVL